MSPHVEQGEATMLTRPNPELRRFDSIVEAIGNTPLVRLQRVAEGLDAPLWAKVEYLNPGLSIKDRMAQYIIDKAVRSGEIGENATIIENTSGNTGAAVAMVSAARGYKATFTMPDKMSTEKINSLKAYGAKVVVTPTNVPADSPESYYETAKRMVRETPGAFYLDQYHNPDNIEAHYTSTGPEIWRQTEGQVDVVIGGVGTGGSMSGTGRYLKEQNPKIRVVGVDPEGSVFYDFFKSGKVPEPRAYKVEGIGEDMLTKAMDFSVFDDMVRVTDGECFRMARQITTREGIFVGGSSGGAVAGALRYLADHPGFRCAVVILPDSGVKYLSKVFNDEWMRDSGFLEAPSRLGTVRDLLGDDRSEVVTVRTDDKVFEVVDKLKKHAISQLIVMDGDELKGVVTEADLLRRMMTSTHSIVEPVGSLEVRAVLEVTLDTPLADVSGAFTTEGRKMAVVRDNGDICGVVTKIDLIEYMAEKFRE